VGWAAQPVDPLLGRGPVMHRRSCSHLFDSREPWSGPMAGVAQMGMGQVGPSDGRTVHTAAYCTCA
jgi:hypothetical protein